MFPLIGLIYTGYHNIDLGKWYVWLLFMLYHTVATLAIVYDIICWIQ